ncbi:MAG: flippase [Patescibacteria group bacterium]|jgi:O-antigen/teichoic acid export membrane protein
MNVSRRIAGNTIIQIFSKAVTAATSALVLAYLARYLGVSGYGDYTTVFAYLGIFGVLVDLGIFVTSVREIAKHPEQERSILGNVLGLRFVVGIVVFAVAIAASLFIPYPPVVRLGILVGSVSQLFMVVNQAPVSLFQARLIMHRAAIADIAGRLILLVLVWWFIKSGLGFIPMIWAVTVSTFVTFIVSMALAASVNPIWPRFDWAIWHRILKLALPMGAVMILSTVYFRIDTVLLSIMKGSFDVGVYGAPYKILEVLLAVPTIFMSSVLPVMTRALDENSKEHALGIFRRSFDFMSLVSLPLVVGTMLLATPIMVLIAGTDFAVSGPVLAIIMLKLVGSALNSVMIYTIIAAGEQRRLLLPYSIAVGFNLIANLIFIPQYSYMAAAVITVLTEIWVLIAAGYLVGKRLKLTPTFGVLLKCLVGSLLMGGAVWYLSDLNLWWRIAVGAVIYVLASLIMRAVRIQDIYELMPKLRRL